MAVIILLKCHNISKGVCVERCSLFYQLENAFIYIIWNIAVLKNLGQVFLLAFTHFDSLETNESNNAP